MIGIIDYGMGNLRSVENALGFLEEPYRIVTEAQEFSLCDKLILPGVGAFADSMDNLKKRDLSEELIRTVKENRKPLLGICLGMQMLYEGSEENGDCKGLGFLKGYCRRMEGDVRIPEIGWNLLEPTGYGPYAGIHEHFFVYYVHSYFATEIDETQLYGFSMYGEIRVPGLVGKDNVLGAQFHPEKSGEDGLDILRFFAKEFV